MRLLDRYIVKSFLINYLLAFGVLVGMYILLDLVVNFDRFAEVSTDSPRHLSGSQLFWTISADIANYYGYQMLVIFQQVCVAIPLLAAGFTMVRMTRSNELTAMLASGVSLYRVAAPIILCSIGFSLLVIVDQEALMPHCVDKLLRRHEDVSPFAVGQNNSNPINFLRDSDNSLLMATRYDPRKEELTDLKIFQRDSDGMLKGRIRAPMAYWDNKYSLGPGITPGAWVMPNSDWINDQPGEDPNLRAVDEIKDHTYTTGLTPEQLDLVFQRKAVEYLSSAQIHKLIVNSPTLTRPELEKIMHTRFTQPLMNVILLLIGIPFLLTRIPRQLMINMMYCGAVTVVCFVGTFVIFSMAGTVLPVLLGAWLPVLIFGPFSLAMLDTIKT